MPFVLGALRHTALFRGRKIRKSWRRQEVAALESLTLIGIGSTF
jgi:hypothetical protein